MSNHFFGVFQNGQTPLSIAQKLGYISVVEALKGVTTADGSTPQPDEKYRVIAPETMQEIFMSDSEDENGKFQPEVVPLYFCLKECRPLTSFPSGVRSMTGPLLFWFHNRLTFNIGFKIYVNITALFSF